MNKNQVVDELTKQLMGQMMAVPAPGSAIQTLLDSFADVMGNDSSMGKQEFDEAYESLMLEMVADEVPTEATEWISKFRNKIYERMGWA